MSNFQFRQLDLLSEIEQFRQFHNELFKNTNASSEWLLWYCTIHGKDKYARVYGVWDQSNLIGIWCVEPKLFQIMSRKINVGRCFSVGIHDEYRRRNLFVQLSKFAIEQERKLGQLEYIFGFPQEGKPVIDAHLKSGWYHVQNISMYSCNTHPETNVSLTDIHSMNSSPYRQTTTTTNGSFIEDQSYKAIRWTRHPDLHYINLRINNGYVVVKPYNNICHILDFYGYSNDIKILLNAVRTLAHRHKWKEVTIWNADNELYHNDILSCGFTPGSKNGLSVSMLAVNINEKENIKLDTCHLQMGIEEVY